jgi:protease I
LRTDISNAGGHWVDKDVVSDNGLITSRNPNDIPAFNKVILETFSTGGQAQMRAAS